MKKFLAVKLWPALLLAGMFCIVSCPDPLSPEKPTAIYSVAGYPIITIGYNSVNGEGGARALTTDTAKSAINYYEVIFLNGAGNFGRLSWFKGQTARVAVPPADYNGGTARAILLAGTTNGGPATDLTLLAVGVLTNSDGGGAATEITTSTTSATFTLYGLDAAPSTNPGTAPSNGVKPSSFKITNNQPISPGAPSHFFTLPDYITNDANYPSGLPVASITGGVVPYFRIPKNIYDMYGIITAAYTIPALVDPAYNYGGHPLGFYLRVNNGTGIGGPGDPTGTLTASGYSGGNPPNGPALITMPYPGIIINHGARLDTTNGEIQMHFNTPDEDGLCMLFFDLPVSGLDLEVPGGLIWHIRGGMTNYLLDSIQGGGTGQTNTTGGGILLAIGDADPANSNPPPQALLYKTAARTPVPEAGTTLASILAWFQGAGNVADGDDFYLVLKQDVQSGLLKIDNAFYDGATNVSLTLEGSGGERILKTTTDGLSFIDLWAGYTLTLQNGITLKGLDPSHNSVVHVRGGTLYIKDGGRITGNNGASGITLYGGNIHIEGGSIDNCDNPYTGAPGTGDGGGIYAIDGTITMSGGEIKNNTATDGGGVFIAPPGQTGNTVTMTITGGKIRNNSAIFGGGVFITGSNNHLTISNGEISGNAASGDTTPNGGGGGILIANGRITFQPGGSIVFSGNVDTSPKNAYNLYRRPSGLVIDDTSQFPSNVDGFIY